MKKINSDIFTQIKEKHIMRCIDLAKKKNIFLDDKKAEKLFAESPFDIDDGSIVIKQNFLKNFPKSRYDFRTCYTEFRNYSYKEWCGLKLLKDLEITVCPYCGINYFSITEKTNSNIVTVATFDHYLPKNKYPQLALNLYNLIPSCKNCNSTFKGQSTKLILNPFFYSLEDNIKFKIKNLMSIDNEKENIDIEVVNTSKTDNLKKLVKSHLTTLCIKERYNNFQSIARTIIRKKRYYNANYLNELEKYKGLNFEPDEIKNMLLYQDILDTNEPFKKFKEDIWHNIDY